MVKKIIQTIIIILLFSFNSNAADHDQFKSDVIASIYSLDLLLDGHPIDLVNQFDENWMNIGDPELLEQYTQAKFNFLENRSVETTQSLEDIKDHLNRICIAIYESEIYKTKATIAKSYNNFDENPYISEEIKEKILPFLLPANHKWKRKLDRIFLNKRVNYSPQTIHQAGFDIFFWQRNGNFITRHHSLPGVVIKMNCDAPSNKYRERPNSHHFFFKRVYGADLLKKIIKQHHIKHFVVPNKWAYPLPLQPAPPNNNFVYRKDLIVVEDSLKIANRTKTLEAYKTKMTKQMLDEFYIVLVGVGFANPSGHNIPYYKNKKFAFIDLERSLAVGPSLIMVRPYLSTPMQEYWDELIRNGGPIK